MKGTALAPMQHIRSATRSAAVLLGATLALSACGSQQAGAAAIINGQPISDKDVQNVTRQLNEATGGAQKVPQRDVLLNLIIARFVLPEADSSGKSVTEAQARKVISKLASPSRLTLDLVRMQLVAQSLTPASAASIRTKISKAKITVNPRYGTFDPKRGLVAASNNWLKAAPPTQSASGQQ
jgi:hypothetical protein